MDSTSTGFGAGARAAAAAGGAIVLAGCLPTLGFYSLEAVVTVALGTVAAVLAVAAPGSCDRALATRHGRRLLRALGPVLLLMSAYRHALEPQPGVLVAPLGLLAFILLVIALLRSPADDSPLGALLPGLAVWSPAAALLETRLMYVEVAPAAAVVTSGWLAGLALVPVLLWSAGRQRIVRSASLVAILAVGIVVRGGAIVASPDPVIDVYSLLQQKPRDLLRGDNPYLTELTSPYGSERARRFRMGTQAAETDPPWYPPGFVLLGTVTTLLRVDPRWWLPLAWTVAAVFSARLGSDAIGRREAGLVAGCLALAPAASFTTEQAWMDPVWAVLMAAALATPTPLAAGLLAGLGLTVKQTAALLLPAVLLAGRHSLRVGLVAAVVAAVLVLPFLFGSPGEFLDDCLFGFLARDLPATGLCLPAAILRLTSLTVPSLPLTGLGIAAAVGLAWIARADPPRLVAAGGAGLAVFSLLNKYAFMNFYEVATMLLYLSAAWPARGDGDV